MDDFLDVYLGKILKKWVGQHHAPEHIRRRLLSLAAHPPSRKKVCDFYPPFQVQRLEPDKWEHFLLTCDIIHSCQNGLTVSRILV
jgi:hypothetical protein